jgi:hypothetical protein
VVKAHNALVAPLVSAQLRSNVYDPAGRQAVLLLRVSDIVVDVPLVFFVTVVLDVLFSLATIEDSFIPSLSVAVAEYAMVSQYLYTPVGLVAHAPPSQTFVMVGVSGVDGVDADLQYRYTTVGLLQSG